TSFKQNVFGSLKLESGRSYWMKLSLEQATHQPKQNKWLLEVFLNHPEQTLKVYTPSPDGDFDLNAKKEQKNFTILKGREFNSHTYLIPAYEQDKLDI